MELKVFKIAESYTRTPGPRYKHEGKWSGEQFRTEQFFDLVNNAIRDNYIVSIDLDGTAGYATSFLEEIFGGLIRKHNLNYDDILKHIKIVSDEEPYLIDDIHAYLEDAEKHKLVVV